MTDRIDPNYVFQVPKDSSFRVVKDPSVEVLNVSFTYYGSDNAGLAGFMIAEDGYAPWHHMLQLYRMQTLRLRSSATFTAKSAAAAATKLEVFTTNGALAQALPSERADNLPRVRWWDRESFEGEGDNFLVVTPEIRRSPEIVRLEQMMNARMFAREQMLLAEIKRLGK